jgi:hypothetical protein
MKKKLTNSESIEISYRNALKMIRRLQGENYELRKELAETISELKGLQEEGQEQDLSPYPEPLNLGCDFIKLKNLNESLLKGAGK